MMTITRMRKMKKRRALVPASLTIYSSDLPSVFFSFMYSSISLR
jgi:hypothetical protein